MWRRAPANMHGAKLAEAEGDAKLKQTQDKQTATPHMLQGKEPNIKAQRSAPTGSQSQRRPDFHLQLPPPSSSCSFISVHAGRCEQPPSGMRTGHKFCTSGAESRSPDKELASISVLMLPNQWLKHRNYKNLKFIPTFPSLRESHCALHQTNNKFD